MTTTSVSLLRQKLQTYLALAAAGQRIRVTAHGRPVADIIPPASEPDAAETARKRLRGSVVEFSDPISPAMDPDDWNMSR
ncbi:MAG: type II toxin-antitoxin system prevent-host-death family antitoxin [Steroidobacteraceae bacterium]